MHAAVTVTSRLAAATTTAAPSLNIPFTPPLFTVQRVHAAVTVTTALFARCVSRLVDPTTTAAPSPSELRVNPRIPSCILTPVYATRRPKGACCRDGYDGPGCPLLFSSQHLTWLHLPLKNT